MKRLWWWLPLTAATTWAALLALGTLGWFGLWVAIIGLVLTTSPAALRVLARPVTRRDVGPQGADYHRIRELERGFGMELTPLPDGTPEPKGPPDYFASVRVIVADVEREKALRDQAREAHARPAEVVPLHPPLTEAQLRADAVDYWSRVPPTNAEIDANVRRIDAKVRRLASEETTR